MKIYEHIPCVWADFNVNDSGYFLLISSDDAHLDKCGLNWILYSLFQAYFIN